MPRRAGSHAEHWRFGRYPTAHWRCRGYRVIDRRKLVALLGGTLLAWPLELRGQEPGRSYRLGVLSTSPRNVPQYVALFSELRRLGFVEGQNLTIDPRGFGLHGEQFPEATVTLLNAPVDVIFAGGVAAIRAAQRVTAAIPILGSINDMVGEGLVRSM